MQNIRHAHAVIAYLNANAWISEAGLFKSVSVKERETDRQKK